MKINYTQLFEEKDWLTVGDDTQYKILNLENEYIIVFQGSNSKTDWKYNFMFRQKPYKDMPIPFYVHRGYLKVWKKINDFFLEQVKNIEKPITIVGHSYGGAVATLCSEDIWFKYPKKRRDLKLITYGSPRLISFINFRKIKKRWNNSFTFSNTFDLVSLVPPRFFGYVHVSKPILLGKKKPLLEKLRIIRNHFLDKYDKYL